MLYRKLDEITGLFGTRLTFLKSELRIETPNDLLEHYPFRYVDRSVVAQVADATEPGEYYQLEGRIENFVEEGEGAAKRIRSRFSDESGSIELVWFKGIRWLKTSLKPGVRYSLYGKLTSFKGALNMVHPELDPVEKVANPLGGLQPVYSTTEKLSKTGLNSKGIERVITSIVSRHAFQLAETLPEDLRAELKLIGKTEAMRAIHVPRDARELQQAQRRLKFEELFFIQMELCIRKEMREKSIQGFSFDRVGEYFHAFYEKCLPFELTGAQKRVIKEIRADMVGGKHMNRLLQGDVGSGKTIVAALSALIAIDNGFQATLVAPTEILAQQHYLSLKELLAPIGVEVALLTGSTRKAQRRVQFEALAGGTIHLLIGTHAVLEDPVVFKNLGLAIIDEQHRFGVAQRARLWKKNLKPPHVLVMTATPIPRTLAMTLYGDLDVSVIDELPPGRKPIKTVHLFDKDRLRIFGFIKEQIALGRQVYVVYPLIEESSTLDLKDLMDGYESIARAFPIPDYQISIVHGRMKPKDKDFEMRRFAKGETQILVATTVIEVGVNVPNASVMVIESAQRFGLSQLHQLRGRVGRGADQSFCILATDAKLSSEARMRMRTMVETNDGFRIAEVDLELRGPGDLMGTQQSGTLDLKIANLATDSKVLYFARQAALSILERDPELRAPEHAAMRAHLKEILKDKPNWSRIS